MGWAWKLMSDLALEASLSGTVYLYDINYKSAQKNEQIGNRLYARADCKGKWKYKAVKTIEQSLEKADFVVISILPGTFDDMDRDISISEKYGIYHSVGDTTGPAGFTRALRTIPVYAEFAEKIKNICPDAWVINYTNPMSLCVAALYKSFPAIKAFGCCHEVLGTKELLADILFKIHNIKASAGEIKINVKGINHFTWVDEASYQTINLINDYKKFAEDYFTGYQTEKNQSGDLVFQQAHRVQFDLFKKYGIIAAAGDRHLAEFHPDPYLKNTASVKQWKFNLTPISWRRQNLTERKQKSDLLADGRKEINLEPSGEEGVQQIKALLGLQDIITNVNLPNNGQVPGIPAGAIVETNAVFTRNSIRPVWAGRLPDKLEVMISRQVNNLKLVLEASLEKSFKKYFSAIENDPLALISGSDLKLLAQELTGKEKYFHNNK